MKEENFGDHVYTVSSLPRVVGVYFKISNESKVVESFQSAFELRKHLHGYL